MKLFKKSLFLFHRDLRMQDNTGLIEACKQSEEVIPCFIFDPNQVEKNSYKSDHILQFMVQSLQELSETFQQKNAKLYLLAGKTTEVVETLMKEQMIDAIFSNRDYTPFAIKRDHALSTMAKKHGISFFHYADALLTEPEEVFTKAETPYQVYSSFFKSARLHPVKQVQKNGHKNYWKGKLPFEVKQSDLSDLYKPSQQLYVNGGRKEALRLLQAAKKLNNYEEERNIPSIKGTTGLSAHHKFGTLSIRETYWFVKEQFGTNSGLIGELYWRDFFTHIAFHYPHIFGHAFRKKYDKITWKNNKQQFKAWKEGKTGFPIVDAGMRQLNSTGYMHNRVRMITASFLVKDLFIDWRWGEKYYAQQLVDYDPSVNNGNWQWAASTGCDSQPYFRIFNPWLQQKKFDPDAIYIKQWVPELADLEPKEVHKLHEKRPEQVIDYPEPMINHKEASQYTKEQFKQLV